MLRNELRLLSVFAFFTFTVGKINARTAPSISDPSLVPRDESVSTPTPPEQLASFDRAQGGAQSCRANVAPVRIRNRDWNPLCNSESCWLAGDTPSAPITDNGGDPTNFLGTPVEPTQLAVSPSLGGESELVNGADPSFLEQSATPPLGGAGGAEIQNAMQTPAVDLPWGIATQNPDPNNPALNGVDSYLTTAGVGTLNIASAIQNPDDGRPIMDCFSPIDDQTDSYVVHEITFQAGDQTSRYPHALLVSDMILPYDIRYDVTPRDKKVVFRRIPNFKFFRNNEMLTLSKVVRRGWLVGHDGSSKQAALDWFESVAKNIKWTQLGLRGPQYNTHYSAIWVGRVLRALDNSQSPFWIRNRDAVPPPPT